MDSLCPFLVHLGKGSAATESEIIKAGLDGSDVAAKADAMKRRRRHPAGAPRHRRQPRPPLRRPHRPEASAPLPRGHPRARRRRPRPPPPVPWAVPIRQRLRNNLRHADEYVCGVTLRFLCRVSRPQSCSGRSRPPS
ncbi:hypothetical protein ZWY2020_050166 [Hordeum vulgare]|nr:hypothetical protein ZWY2020_050166 [Hordeum vulgare]